MPLDIFLFGSPTIRMIEDRLRMNVRRSELIAGNLANAETPGYKARDLDFQKVMDRAAVDQGIRLAVTDPGHIDDSLNDEIVLSSQTGKTGERVDGNTVDLDGEMGKLAGTQLLYEAGLTALSQKFSMLKKAATGAD